MKRTQAGFILIELMIVIAILGILAAIAIPAYQDYSIRAKISEAINTASPAKLSVSEYFQSEGALPANRTEAGTSDIVTEYVSELTIDDGVIYVTVDTAASPGTGATTVGCDNLAIRLTPLTSGTVDGGATRAGAVDWSCNGVADNTGAALAAGSSCTRLLPSSCR